MSRHKREATQEELDVILKLKEEGCSQAVIAENVGLSKSMVRRILKDEFAEEKEMLDIIFAEDNPEKNKAEESVVVPKITDEIEQFINTDEIEQFIKECIIAATIKTIKSNISEGDVDLDAILDICKRHNEAISELDKMEVLK